MYPFYSNCLIEAIRHKLRNWRGVKIKRDEVYMFHFYWTENGRAYEFKPVGGFPTKANIIFLGYVNRRIRYRG